MMIAVFVGVCISLDHVVLDSSDGGRIFLGYIELSICT